MTTLTKRFLSLHAGVLFLFTLMCSFDAYSSSDPSQVILTSIVNFVGAAGMLIWCYAICQKSLEVLKKRQISINLDKTYYYPFIVGVVTIIAVMVLNNIDPQTISTQRDLDRGTNFTYKFIFGAVALMLIIVVLFIVRNTVKLLSSAETGNEQSISDYYKTFLLLLLFPWVAVWFIQPRVRKI